MTKSPATNSTYKKLAGLCYADTFVVNEYLVLRNYIRAESRQLLVAAKRYLQPYGDTVNFELTAKNEQTKHEQARSN
jgi:hypothetical protein